MTYYAHRDGNLITVLADGEIIGQVTVNEYPVPGQDGPDYQWIATMISGLDAGAWWTPDDAIAELIIRDDRRLSADEARQLAARAYGADVRVPAGYPTHGSALVGSSYEIMCCGQPVAVSPAESQCSTCRTTFVVRPGI